MTPRAPREVRDGKTRISGTQSARFVRLDIDDLDLELVEATNLHVVSVLIAAAALRRTESRGCHRRRDAAATWREARHTLMRWTPDGVEVRWTLEGSR